MRRVHVDPAGSLVLVEGLVPTPSADEVLLRTSVSAVCGSDLHRFRGADSYGVDTDVFGHETVGVVLDGTDAFPAGTRVLHVPFPADGRVFAEYQTAKRTQLVPVDDALPSTTAVLGQQLGTVVDAVERFERAGATLGDVFVCGGGPAGVLFARLLAHRGARVRVAEIAPFRRAVLARSGVAEPGPVAPVFDLAIDTTGTLEGRRECIARTRRGGVIGMFGLPDDEPGDLGLSLLDLLHERHAIVGVIGAQADPALGAFRTALRLLLERAVVVDDLITRLTSLDDLPAAVAIAAAVPSTLSKVVLDLEH
jgi:L-iditol 2-dehydrogenase